MPSPIRNASAFLAWGMICGSSWGMICGASACGGSAASGTAGPDGSGGNNGDGADSGVDIAALCNDLTQDECVNLATCDPKDFTFPSYDACAAAVKAGCDSVAAGTSVFAALGLGTGLRGENYDPNAFLACEDKKVALGPSCKPPPNVTAADVLAARAACAQKKLLQPGSRPLGGACLFELQCQAGLTCSTETSSADGGPCGTCVPLAAGASCTGSNECGLFFNLTCDTKSNTCTKEYAEAGDDCSVLTCDPAAFLGCDSVKKVCAPLATSGQSCASIPCDTSLFLDCSRATETCKDEPRNVGDACAPEGVCGPGLFCDSDGGTCQALRGSGASCAGVYQQTCDPLQGLGCDSVSSTCVDQYAHLGQACGSPSGKQCWQTRCVQPDPAVAGTCTAYGVPGTACTEDADCESLLACVDNVCKTIGDAIAEFADASADAVAQVGACN